MTKLETTKLETIKKLSPEVAKRRLKKPLSDDHQASSERLAGKQPLSEYQLYLMAQRRRV